MPAPLPSFADDLSVAATLLVMVPPAAPRVTPGRLCFTAAEQTRLQHQLGAAVQVLRIDQAEYPAVVRSFAPLQLPACVLVWRGLELWRQEGLPEPDQLAPVVLSRIQAVAAAL